MANAIFAPATVFGSGGNTPYNLAVADFNGDSLPDVAAANIGGTAGVLTNNGLGGFGTAASYSTVAIYNVSAGDFNSYGRPEMAVTAYPNVRIMINNGLGGFTSGGLFNNPSGAYNIATGDLNGDGKLDLVVGNSGISALLGDGAGNFTSIGYLPNSQSYYIHDVQIVDL
ncbi:MAG: VCBS repeat-containing protein, partial [Singulisphaera sp.]